MPSPSSSRHGIVCGHHATEVQVLRPAPLPPAAGESMKITGASRRSAAPGSQKVGAAEYGGDLCGLQRSWSARTKGRILGPLTTMRIAASFPPSAQAWQHKLHAHGPPTDSPRRNSPNPYSLRHHGHLRYPLPHQPSHACRSAQSHGTPTA
jgi:hypothetical protein